jgi:hypothetical protein
MSRHSKQSLTATAVEGYEVVSMRHFAIALQRAHDRGHIEQALRLLHALAREHEGAVLVKIGLREQVFGVFKWLGICSGATGTAAPTINRATGQVASGGVTIAVDWLPGTTAGCMVTVRSVEVSVGSAWIPTVEQPGGGPNFHSGFIDNASIPGGAAALRGTTLQVRVTFNTDASGLCDICRTATGIVGTANVFIA